MQRPVILAGAAGPARGPFRNGLRSSMPQGDVAGEASARLRRFDQVQPGTRPPPRSTSPLAREHLPVRPGDVRHSQADQARFESLFPAAEAVPLADGLARTVEWFRSGRVES